MINYNTLPLEQKESITKELRVLFEELERLNIENLKFLSKLSEIYEDNDFKRSKETLELNEEVFWETILIQEAEGKIKGFQEGEKLAIKIIDEEIKIFYDISKGISAIDKRKTITGKKTNTEIITEKRIEELEKQREHLEWESNLE